jgi:N-acetylneuraminate lyase
MPDTLRGLIPAVPTPLAADGSLRLEGVEPIVEHLLTQTVAGAFVCGTTGEGMSLSVPERLQVAQRWCAASPPSLRVIVHVGHTSLEDAKTLAAGAQRSGAWAIAAHAPPFFRPKRVEDLVEYCAELAAAAPGLPFFYYHIPSLTGVTIPVRDFLALASRRIPTLRGIKFTHNDLLDFGRSMDFEEGRFAMLFGLDEQLLSALVMGTKAAVGTTYGFAAPIYRRLIQAYEAGDLDTARAQQRRSREMIAAMFKAGLLPAIKAAYGWIGLDVGPVRLPLAPLSTEEEQTFRDSLEKLGILDECQRVR